MKYGWETQEEKLRRYMRISAKRKMEWLLEMNRFQWDYLPRATRALRVKLKRLRS